MQNTNKEPFVKIPYSWLQQWKDEKARKLYELAEVKIILFSHLYFSADSGQTVFTTVNALSETFSAGNIQITERNIFNSLYALLKEKLIVVEIMKNGISEIYSYANLDNISEKDFREKFTAKQALIIRINKFYKDINPNTCLEDFKHFTMLTCREFRILNSYTNFGNMLCLFLNVKNILQCQQADSNKFASAFITERTSMSVSTMHRTRQHLVNSGLLKIIQGKYIIDGNTVKQEYTNYGIAKSESSVNNA